jgi:hypothetical protein
MTTNTNISPLGLVTSILCPEEDVHGFCRRLVTKVNDGPMHLASVITSGSQIYPVRVDAIGFAPTILRCEFRMRNTGTPVSAADACDLLDRLSGYQILDSHFVDKHGSVVRPFNDYLVAS